MKFLNALGISWLVLTVVSVNGAPRGDQDALDQEESYHGPKIFEENVFSVSPKSLDTVFRTLKEANVSHTTIIEDLQRSIDAEHAAQNEAAQIEGDLGPRPSFIRYMTYKQIVDNALDLATRHDDRVQVDKIGKTYEGRDIIAVRLSSSFGVPTPTVVIEAGAHAREWIAPAVAVYLINQIAEVDSVAQELLNNLNWYIIPVLNPDGYEYTHDNPKQRLWVKNRYRVGKCYGVDLDRNFDYHWKESGGSTSPCEENYVGSMPFSELETTGFKNYVVASLAQIKMYISLHSFGYAIAYPWAFTASHPADADELQCIGEEANKAMVNAGSPKSYKVGASAEVIGVASGVGADWAKGAAKIEKAFTLMLPNGGQNGYDVPPPEIERIAKQLLEGFKVFAKYVAKNCRTARDL